MKYKKYLVIAFMVAVLLPLASAKSISDKTVEELDMSTVMFIGQEEQIELGFDTSEYLPEGFNPYDCKIDNIHSINFIEEGENIELGFDTTEYLPAGFNPYL